MLRFNDERPLKVAAVAIILSLLAVLPAATFDTVANIGRPYEQASFEPFTRCNDAGDAGDLMWDGSRIASRSGIQYATVEITKLVYGGGVPSEIGLKAPISIDGVTFSSPSPESFTATILLGVLYITATFADGTQRNLSAIVFLPPIRDGMPQGCALLVTHEDQQAGFVVVFTPGTDPLDNPALGYTYLGKVFQGRIYLIARANMASTTVVPPPTNPQTTNATLEYDLMNRLKEDGAACTYEWGPIFALYRSGDQFSFNFSSTSPIDVYVFDPDYYSGTVSCTYGPMVHAPYEPMKLTGMQGPFGTACLGCEKEGGKESFFYVVFINHDTTVTPHVTLQVAVSSYVAAAVCVPSAESSLIVHVADAWGNAIEGAGVFLNGTYNCKGSSYTWNPSASTGLDGDAWFKVVPYTRYSITVVPPPNFLGWSMADSQITAGPPTMPSRITVTLGETTCAREIPRSSLTVHLADERGTPVPNAAVFLNGAYRCNSANYPSHFSGATDSNGNVAFYVLAGISYDATVVPPPTFPSSEPLVITGIRASPPTMSTTVNVAIAARRSETQTTSITTASVPFLDLPAILIAILLGFFIVARRRRSGA